MNKRLIALFNCPDKNVQYAIKHQNEAHGVDYKFNIINNPDHVAVIGEAQDIMFLIGFAAAMGDDSLFYVGPE